MAAYLSPIGNEQQSDANGAPLAGGFIYTYAAGTTTPIATYTDDTGSTPQANPIVLNASGLPANPIWLPAGQAVKLVIQNGASAVQRTVDDVQGVNDPAYTTSQSEWTPYTGTPTYISATSFSLAGDQTNTFLVNRRLRSTNTGGTAYSTVTASSYNGGTGLTTVTVANDSTTLDAGLSAVSYALLSSTNTSIPASIRVDVASAATVNLTTSAPNCDDVRITGTTTIGAFTIAAGRSVRVVFSGILTLTNSASLTTNTSADIVTVAGDSCVVRATAANTVEIVNYTRALPLNGSSTSLSGTSTDITGIPAHARLINIAFSAVGGSSTGKLAIQLGSTTFPANGHAYNSSNTATSNNASSGDRFVVCQNAMSNLNISGGVTLTRVGTSNTWAAFGLTSSTGAAAVPTMFNGQVSSLTGVLDRIRITSSTGTETLSGTVGLTWS
jgi:hypothetical protein